ncbi:MAG: hypothetical protein JXR37_35430 [Kiritimatiellae bacterium]|nr:hypothetical protein [Kiritimatiellia bacterium]
MSTTTTLSRATQPSAAHAPGALSARDRCLKAVRFRKPDTVPIWTPGYAAEFVARWQAFMRNDSLTPRDFYRHDTSILIGNETFFPSTAGPVRQDGEYEIRRDGWGRTVRARKGAVFSEMIDSVLNDKRELDRLAFEPYESDMRYHRLAERAQAGRAPGVFAIAKVGGLFRRTGFLRGEEDLLVDMALDEPFCDALFDKVAEHLRGMALETLRRTDTWANGLMVFDDMAMTNGPVFSPAMFERYLLPRYQRMIDAWRRAGCAHVYIHSDGNVAPLLDLYLACGFEGCNPLEPRCVPDLMALRERYGTRLIAIGGVCNTRILQTNDRRLIARHIEPLVELALEGGVILGTASIPAEVPPGAYHYAMELMQAV